MSSRSSRTLYVGNLPGDVREREVEDLFYKVNNLSVFLFLCNFILNSSLQDTFILLFSREVLNW